MQLAQDLRDVVLDCAFGEVELLGNVAIGHALGYQGRNLLLAAGEG